MTRSIRLIPVIRKVKLGLGFGMSADESHSDSEDGGHSDVDKSDLEGEKSRTEEVADQEIRPMGIKWNREGENKLQGVWKRVAGNYNQIPKISSRFTGGSIKNL